MALSIATAILWLSMGVFIATAVYSATQLGISISDAQVGSDGLTVIVTFNITIDNGGFHDMTNVTLTAKILLGDLVVTTSTSGPFSIRSGELGRLPCVIEIDLVEAMSNMTLLRTLMTEDVDMNLTLAVDLFYAYMVGVELSTSFSAPWGAPMSGLEAHPTVVGSTMDVDMSFTNNSPISYTFKLEVLNSTRGSVGFSDLQGPISPGQEFSKTISIPLDMAYWTPGEWYLMAHVMAGGYEVVFEVIAHV